MKELNKIYNQDCMEGMKELDDGCIDLIITDAPYSITLNPWDAEIDIGMLWTEYKRLLKPNGVVVLTAAQPFTTTLISANLEWFKCEWIWAKRMVTGHLNAHKRPMRRHESVLVFSPAVQYTYNPQNLIAFMKTKTRGHNGTNFGVSGAENFQEWTNYPTTILDLDFMLEEDRFHPTQKPLSLFQYLIRTYSNEGDLILDNFMGAGTTALACTRDTRNFIGFELDYNYFIQAEKRLLDAKNLKMKVQADISDLFY